MKRYRSRVVHPIRDCDLNSPQLALETIDRFVTVRQQTCQSQMYCSSISSIVLRKSTSASKFIFAVTQQNEIHTLSNCESGIRCFQQLYHILKYHLKHALDLNVWNTAYVCKFPNTLERQLLKRPAQTKVHLLLATPIVWSLLYVAIPKLLEWRNVVFLFRQFLTGTSNCSHVICWHRSLQTTLLFETTFKPIFLFSTRRSENILLSEKMRVMTRVQTCAKYNNTTWTQPIREPREK